MSFNAGSGITAAQLNQTYGMADAVPTTVTGTAFTNLSSVYPIPAGEPRAGSAYELECGGYGVQGSTQQSLALSMTMNGAAFGGSPAIGAVLLNANQAFRWALKYRLICADGISAWWCTLAGFIAESGANILPGTGGQQSAAIADANTGVRTQAVTAAISVAIQAKWGSATGAPTITNTSTIWRKVA